jgi:hypothetical protein
MAESAEELLRELETAAREYAPVEAELFAITARDDLADWRQTQDRERQSELGEERIPAQYRSRAEEFLVFDAFVRIFLDPIATAVAIGSMLDEMSNLEIRSLTFGRFGDDGASGGQISRDNIPQLRHDRNELQELTAEFGRATFGNIFRTADFWGRRE